MFYEVNYCSFTQDKKNILTKFFLNLWCLLWFKNSVNGVPGTGPNQKLTLWTHWTDCISHTTCSAHMWRKIVLLKKKLFGLKCWSSWKLLSKGKNGWNILFLNLMHCHNLHSARGNGCLGLGVMKYNMLYGLTLWHIATPLKYFWTASL